MEPDGSYVLLVIRLEVDDDGRASVSLDGTLTLPPTPLKPATLVVRLWHADSAGALRGTVLLRNNAGNRWVPIQCNDQLVDLLHSWLLLDGAAKGEG